MTSRTVISKLDRDIIHKIMLVNYNTPIAFRRQGLSPKHCTGDRDQDHPHGKEMQKSKMAVWGSLTNSCEKKRSEKHQSCPTLCDPIDSSPPGSPVPGILQSRTLEWVAISFSNM